MSVKKVKYICVSPTFLGDKQNQKHRLMEELSGLMSRSAQSLKENLGWLRLESMEQGQKGVFFYNRNVRGLFPDLSRIEYTSPLVRINSPVDMNKINFLRLSLDGMYASLIEKTELLAAFPSKSKMERVAAQWHWSPGLLSQYFAVFPCEQGGEVCRVDGECSTYWGADTPEKACLICVVRLANCVAGHTWLDDFLFLLRKCRLLPVLGSGERDVEFPTQYGALLQDEDVMLDLNLELLNPSEDAMSQIVIPADKEQSRELKKELLECDYYRAGLAQYDDSILTPLNGHWDLWKYVQYNDTPREQLPPPPEGKIWVDVSKENIYARNAADDLAPAAETVAVDFGTKSTTIARKDNEGNIVTLLIGEDSTKKTGGDAGDERGYENPTILKYINLDRFQAAYGSAVGRPETKISDLSASHAAEREFEKRTLDSINGILAYQYQIKQWAYDNQFAPLIFDSRRQIVLKPYREIGEKDFDPIEAYAYLVGLTVVNMRRKRICTRYVLSYPPSYGADICKKMCRSFKRGIRKAIPTEAQQAAASQNGFSVLLRQSEPAAYAVCALKEFAVEHGRALCGVYDLGGGTVDYHFGIFTGGKPPYRYESLQNGGNPRLGCENILEELAYAVFSLVKEELRSREIPYEFPRQYSSNLEDMRYTSHSQLARLNTLGMVNALRRLWIHKLKPVDNMSDRLCRFQVYSQARETLYLEIEAAPETRDKEHPAKLETKDNLLKISLAPGFLSDFFREKIATTVWEFLDMQKTVRDRMSDDLPLVIFLAGNGSQAPMVEELFRKYLPGFGVEDCQLYPPLGTPEAAKLGQWVQNRPGSVPNAKTGVAHGLLIALPGSDFIRIVEEHPDFMFRFHVGVSQYDQESRESVFLRRKHAESFGLFKKYEALADENLDAPFTIEEDGYLQIWYTDATLTQDATPISACGARQFLIRVPDEFLSEQLHEEVRGECYYQAVSETELELFIRPADVWDGYPYGILNLENGLFEAHPYSTAE